MTTDLTECIRIAGIDIELSTIPTPLRRRYDTLRATLNNTKTAQARAEATRAITKLGKEILAEMAPLLAFKAAPRAHDARGFFQSLNNR